MKKTIIMFLLLILSVSLFACNNEMITTDRLIVIVKAEYYEQFEVENFTIIDFQYDNIEKIVYGKWYDKSEQGYITVYLKKHGKKNVLNAIKHCKTLYFVQDAEPIGITTIYD